MLEYYHIDFTLLIIILVSDILYNSLNDNINDDKILIKVVPTLD